MRSTIAILSSLLWTCCLSAAILEVGPDKPFDRIELALAKAHAGDEVVVYPLPDGKAYPRTALMVRTARLTIRSSDPQQLVALDGKGFDYSGQGSIPRAIVQFDPSASGSTLEGFDLAGARNFSFNAAGVRINAANDITIRRCSIHHNDMGIMSNGSLQDRTGTDQLIDACTITRNGSDKEPGYNHNLYLGGTSVIVRGCEIAFSTTGHNLKSRAHFNWIEYNFIHDSANRELDLVDAAGNTNAPNSDAVLLGNIITKTAPRMDGNKAVIHFGKDGEAVHAGRVFLVHNTITTPYASPILDISSSTGAVLINNRIDDGKARISGTVISARAQVNLADVIGQGNLFAPSFMAKLPAGIQPGEPVAWDAIDLPWPQASKTRLMQFRHAGDLAPRTTSTPGAKD